MFKLNFNLCASVKHRFYSLCNGHFEDTVMAVMKHVGDLLTSNEHILYM